MILPRLFAVFLAVALFAWPDVGGAGGPSFETSQLSIDTARGRFIFTVEMAVTEDQRILGLQKRAQLRRNAGMLFDYHRPRLVAMWMKNTYLPLDILFIDVTGRIVNIAHDTTPGSLRSIHSAGPVRAVLEINGGIANKLGIRPGDKVLHPVFLGTGE